ncbi:MAG: hypothetical protein R6U31_06320 [bacterium]
MKKIIIIIFTVLAVVSVNAKLLSIEISPTFAQPLSGFRDNTKSGLGFKAGPNLHLLGFLDISAGVGYLTWAGPDNAMMSVSYKSIPVFAGMKIYPFKFMGIPAVPGEPFFYMEPGINIFTTETDFFTGNTNTDKENLTGICIGAGYRIFPGKFGMNVKLDYNYFSGNDPKGFMGISIGILYTLI